jgi:hypothetical protein
MAYNLVTKNVINAYNKAKEWENGEGRYYTDVLGICGKKMTESMRPATYNSAIDKLKKYGATADDIIFWEKSKEHTKRICILPKGHKDNCLCEVKPFNKNNTSARVKNTVCDIFDKGLNLKVRDALMLPGATGIYYNRRGSTAYAPVMCSESGSIIHRQFGKPTSKGEECVAKLERAATGYLMATALLDTLALASLVRGFDAIAKFHSPEMEEMVKHHAKFLVNYYKNKYDINITNDSGFLCALFLRNTYPEYSLAQFGSATGNADDDDRSSMQFSHCEPTAVNEFMSRGLNVLFLTKAENTSMGTWSILEYKEKIKEMYQNV